MKRILYFHAESELGGAGVSLLDLIKLLPSAHYQVMVALPGPGAFSEKLSNLHIPFEYVRLHRFPYHEERYAARAKSFRAPLYWHIWELKSLGELFFSIFAQSRSIKKLIDGYGPDIIHINSVTLLAVGVMARRWKIPIVWHVRDILAKNWLGAWAGSVIPKYAQRVIAVSKAVARRLDNSRGNVVVVYNGIQSNLFGDPVSGVDVRREFNIPSGAPCIGFVGRLTQEKGFLDLLDAAPAILKAFPSVRFLIVGSFARAKRDGQSRNFLESSLSIRSVDEEGIIRSRIHESGLASIFQLTGPRSDVPNLLAAMDVVALPSHSEGFGLTVVEAMAMGKAVVSTRVTAIPELLKHRCHGLLVEPGSPDQLADACIQYLRDVQLASHCGENARRRAKVFTVAREARCIQSIYEELLIEQ